MERAIYDRMREVEDRHWWFAARRDIVGHVIGRLPLPPNPCILEAGCGTGGNLGALSAFGKVAAFEMDPPAVRMAAARAGARVFEGSLPSEVPAFDKPFDLVVMLDVLEHIDDEVGSLAALRRLLVPGGHLLLTVPALPVLWSRHDVAHHHRRRYVRRTLASALTRAGFGIRHLTYYNTLLLPIIGAARALDILLRGRLPLDALRVPGSVANALLRALFGVERYVVARVSLPVGVSLLAVAQRA